MRISNPNQYFDRLRLPWRFLLIACSYFLLLSSSVNSQDADSERNQNLEWQVLTKRNFSSQILLHQHVLLMVTVPWSGESRALMKELAHLAKLKKLDHLRLMVVYSNTEKTLAHSLGVTTETAIFFYNNAISYNYQGRLRAHHILSSVNYIVSLPSEELPLKLLNSSEDLTTFFNSTDKAVILFEFCGWTSRLLDQRNNESGISFNIGDGFDSGIVSGSNHNGQGNGLIEEELTCGINNGPLGIPWLGEFTVANDSAYSETEDRLPQLGLSCTFEEFQRFESFFSNFTTSAREFFLPPERQRFGLVSERHLMLSLGVQDPDPWFGMLHFAGCPNCSRIFKEGDDIKSAFDMNHLLVAELGNVAHDVQSALPANKPSIILFVDRSSESPNTRRKSKAALEAFRKLALHNQFLDQVVAENRVTHRKVSAQPFQLVGDRRTSSRPDHSRRESLQLGQLKNDMSVVIVNDGKAVSLDKISADAEGKSIQDIIAHLIQQQKGSKLSLLAKEAGFQLLSDDFEIKIRELLPQVKELANSDNLFWKAPNENIVESEVNLENTNVPSDTSLFQVKLKEQTGAADLEFQFKEEKSNHNAKNTQISSVNLDVRVEEGHVTEAEKLEEHKHKSREFRGLYFFSDGGYQLLKTLTAGSSIPSMVIVDPVSEKHYLCPEDAIFSYSSLQTFLDAFLNGSLIPYQRSESVTQSLRKATQPPFINMDFHEVDPIPRVTAHTFSEQVLGYNESDVHVFSYSWKKDVLVLFSNSWCGFCQRMELVVHEVFQAFKGYINTSKSVTNKGESTFSSDVGDDMHLEVPLIFLMDCTLNDCSSCLKSMGERELYPALMLFPAQRKSAVPYRGDMSVNNVIDFLVDHGSNSHHLHGIKGAVWNAKQEGTNRVSVEDRLASSVHEEDSVAKYHEVSLNYREPTRLTKTHRVKSHTSNNVIVGSVLVSTDKLLNAPPFDKSIVLIVQANQSTGFLGLIVNKLISWDSFEGLEKGLEMVKQAPLSFGGPLISNGMPLVCLSRGVVREGYSEVFPGVYFMDQTTTVRELEAFKLGTQSSADYWFFLGYSGWGWDQLFSEIAGGAWQVSDDPMAEFGWPGN